MSLLFRQAPSHRRGCKPSATTSCPASSVCSCCAARNMPAGPARTSCPAPARLIEGGIATEATVAHLLVSKYADHLPLYRQAQIYARQRVVLDRSTLADWVGRAAFLLRPVHERMLAALKSSSKLFADEPTAACARSRPGPDEGGPALGSCPRNRPGGGAGSTRRRLCLCSPLQGGTADRSTRRLPRHPPGRGYCGYKVLAERGEVRLALSDPVPAEFIAGTTLQRFRTPLERWYVHMPQRAILARCGRSVCPLPDGPSLARAGPARRQFFTLRLRCSSSLPGDGTQRSRNIRLAWSVNGLVRNESALRSSVVIITSTGIPGRSLRSPSTAISPSIWTSHV